MQKTMQVQSTTDYAKFSLLEGNRVINELHIKRLTQSMEEKYLISPIVVNQDFMVIDGQHRLTCAMSLGLPVYYIVCDGYSLEDVHRYNVNSKNWKYDDYLDGYIELGLPDYIKFKRFIDRYGFGYNECIRLLSGSNDGNVAKEFQKGNLKIKNYDKACLHADSIMAIAPYYTGFRRRSFVMAMISLLRNPEFDINQLLDKLKYQSTKLVDCVNIPAYVALIENIYNYKSRKTIRLAA